METFPRYWPFLGNPPVTGGFPLQRPVIWSFNIFLIYDWKQLSKQSRRRWFETPSCCLWRYWNSKSSSNHWFHFKAWKFALCGSMITAVQDFRTVGEVSNMLGTKGILWIWSRRWVSERYPLWASYQIRKMVGCTCAGNATNFKGNR